jgi:hypothetical protein
MITKWEYSAGKMLHHYRHVLRNYLSFVEVRKSSVELRRRSSLDDESLKYIAQAYRLITNMGRCQLPALHMVLTLLDRTHALQDDGTPSSQREQI